MSAIQLADANSVFTGAGPLALEATKLRDRFQRFVERLIP